MVFILQPYQERAIDFAKDHDRACLVMPTGSGKTLVAIHAAIEFLQKHEDHRILFIGPKPAEKVIPNELDKHEHLEQYKRDFKRKLKVYTFDSFSAEFYKKTEGLVQYRNLENTMIIIDEAHRIKNPNTSTFVAIARHCGLAAQVLMLTATPITHSYYDLLTLQFLLALRMDKMGNQYRMSLMVHKYKNNEQKVQANAKDFIHDYKDLKWKEKSVLEHFDGLCSPFHVEERATVYKDLDGKEPYEAIEVPEDDDFMKKISNQRDLFQSETLFVKTASNETKFSKKYQTVLRHISNAYRTGKRIYVYFPLVMKSRTQAVTLQSIKEHLSTGKFDDEIPERDIIIFDGKITANNREIQLETINGTRKNDPIIVLAGSVLRESSTLKCFDHVVFFGPENTFSDLMQAIGRTIRQSSHENCFPEKTYDKVKVSLFHNKMDSERCETMRKNREIMKDCEREMREAKNYKECELLHLHDIQGLELDKVAKFFGRR